MSAFVHRLPANSYRNELCDAIKELRRAAGYALIEDAIKNSPFAALKDENRFGRLYQAPTGNAGTLLTREENYGAMPARAR